MDSNQKDWEDPIVAEVENMREAIARNFNFDLHAMVEDIKKREEYFEKMGFKFVSLPIVKKSKITGTHG